MDRSKRTAQRSGGKHRVPGPLPAVWAGGRGKRGGTDDRRAVQHTHRGPYWQEDIPTAQVRHRFLMLGRSHLEYVFECLRRNTTEVRNIRAYLLTALYNAPVTMGPYYQAEVQHDFG